MKDLCRLTGLSRQAIHFYVREGLLPAGRKSARNMAYYGQTHLDRLQLIRRLQHERLLPLKAIKAILAHTAGGFDDAQRQMLTELKSRLSASLGERRGEKELEAADAADVAERLGVDIREIERMADIGLLSLCVGSDGTRRIPSDGVWVIELWSQIRALGFTEELGFSVEDLAIYEDALSTLFERETRLVLERLAGLPPEQIAAMVERALPLVHTFFTHYHTTQVRDFFAALE
jgi:DNA-binding transcriptional MerR regulator